MTAASYPLVTGVAPPNASVAIQPGMYVLPVCQVDSTGKFVESGGAVIVSGTVSTTTAGGSAPAYLYRDSAITVQGAGAVTSPAAGATVATCLPGISGLWEVATVASVSGAASDTQDANNMALYQGTISRLSPIPLPVATAALAAGVTSTVTVPPIVLNLGTADTVRVLTLGTTTTSSTYAAAVIVRRVG